jgi:hypothetical protein
MTAPVWEHGFRCHGYWLGVKRVGWVGLSPRVGPDRGSVKFNGYGWGVVAPTGEYVEGKTKTLKAAKRRVEREYARLYAGGAPPPYYL